MNSLSQYILEKFKISKDIKNEDDTNILADKVLSLLNFLIPPKKFKQSLINWLNRNDFIYPKKDLKVNIAKNDLRDAEIFGGINYNHEQIYPYLHLYYDYFGDGCESKLNTIFYEKSFHMVELKNKNGFIILHYNLHEPIVFWDSSINSAETTHKL